MTQDDNQQTQEQPVRWLTADGKPLRVLSTSLGVALLANAVLSTGVSANSGGAAAEEPKLVSWSSDEVKTYFDPNIDWNLPMLQPLPTDQPEGEGSEEGGAGGGSNVVHHYGTGFGWDDLLLYHLLFNSGSSYSSSSYYKKRPTYYYKSSTPYRPTSYTSDTFQNKSVVGSTVRPKTSTTTGSVTRRSTSSSPGGIGGTSSSISSGSKSSSSSSSSSGSSVSSGKSSSGFGG
ncbi:hypothetical protein [Paenibacillus sp. PL2-23]|uniref:hypothetical protein n=1 Tax=Paenibacillus sp. PL2-23 TaxID=2100729 RepID=UPI0030FB63A2